MPQREQVFNRGVGAKFVIDCYRTDRAGLQFAANHRGRNVRFFQVSEHIDFNEQPVRNHDQSFHAAIEQHFQITFETAALVVNVGENGQKGVLIKRAFNPAQDWRAIGIGHVKDHDANGMATLVPQRTREQIGTVSQFRFLVVSGI